MLMARPPREVSGFELFTDIEAPRGQFRLIWLPSATTAPKWRIWQICSAKGSRLRAKWSGQLGARHLGRNGSWSARHLRRTDGSGRQRPRHGVCGTGRIGPAPDLREPPHQLGRKAEQIAAALSAAGIPAHPVEYPALVWTKLFYNAALNPLGALLNLNYGALGEDRLRASWMRSWRKRIAPGRPRCGAVPKQRGLPGGFLWTPAAGDVSPSAVDARRPATSRTHRNRRAERRAGRDGRSEGLGAR